MGSQQEALDKEHELSAGSQAEVAFLNKQISNPREQLMEIGLALAAAEAEKKQQAARIEDFGQRLNIELARRVNELQRYRSAFFGKLKELLGDNQDVHVVGDRFVFQSELLFASGSAQLGETGKQQLENLASSLRDLASRIPGSIDWILRIDGHTDRVPIATARFNEPQQRPQPRDTELRITARVGASSGQGDKRPCALPCFLELALASPPLLRPAADRFSPR